MKKLLVILILSLILTVVASTNCVFAAEYLLNVRDFNGVQVTENYLDFHDYFTWGSCPYENWEEVDEYNEAAVVWTSVNKDIYPEVYMAAGVAADSYRVWIYQNDESWDRSLEVSIGDDPPVRVQFDYTAWGANWKWLDLGLHNVSEATVIKVKAVGDFRSHGQPYPERRGAFMALLLTTNLTTSYPDIAMDTSKCGLSLDNDGDRVIDASDNCPATSNPGQDDYDGDNIGDICDNCPGNENDSQANQDGDNFGDACDNCPNISNDDQANNDQDDFGDICDPDDDNDTIDDDLDNCKLVANPDQEDFDGNGIGDACDDDDDGDGVLDGSDACSETTINSVVDANGCSGLQNIVAACPCDMNPPWKNHGEFVSCVAHTAEEQLDLGLINQTEKDAIVSEQAKDGCGKKK